MALLLPHTSVFSCLPRGFWPLILASPNAKLRSGHSPSRNFDQQPYNTHQIETFWFLFPVLLVRTCVSKILACIFALTAKIMVHSI